MDSYLQKSIIVAAHPDDEILWFSSILQHVDEIICCFSDVASQPKWTEGRKKSLAEYPLNNISSLNVPESEAFDHADWEHPTPMPFGLDVHGRIEYERNYSTLKKKLSERLEGFQNVFTHNPWGEYGHEEHVQVYKVLNELRQMIHFNLWFSNYCSNKTMPFMLECQKVFASRHLTLTTNKVLSNKIKTQYEKNGCWTWYADWHWPERETFFNEKPLEKKDSFGRMVPINLINIELLKKKNKKPNIFHRTVSKILSMGWRSAGIAGL